MTLEHISTASFNGTGPRLELPVLDNNFNTISTAINALIDQTQSLSNGGPTGFSNVYSSLTALYSAFTGQTLTAGVYFLAGSGNGITVSYNGSLLIGYGGYATLASLSSDLNSGKLPMGAYVVSGVTYICDGYNLKLQDGTNLIRQVSSRSGLDYLTSNAYQYILSRSVAFATDGDITNIGILDKNWSVSKATNDVEMAIGVHSMDISAAIEYPAGVFTPLTFGGATMGSIAPMAELASDLVPIFIPKGSKYWIRIYRHNPDGIYFTDKGYAGTGTSSVQGDSDGGMWGTSIASFNGATVTSGNVVTQYTVPGTNNCYTAMPVVIFGTLRNPKPAIALIGDSRVRGEEDTDTSSFFLGELDRSLGQYFNTANFGVSSDKIATFLTNGIRRMAVINKYFTHAIIELGVNDVFSGSASLAQMKANIGSLLLLFPGLKKYLTTLAPLTTSTDNWATAYNQTITANDSVRTGYNTWLRTATISNVSGIVDVAAYVEVDKTNTLSLNGGYWITDGIAGTYVSNNNTDTPYGFHETTLGNILIAKSLILNSPIFNLLGLNFPKNNGDIYLSPSDSGINNSLLLQAAINTSAKVSAKNIGYPSQFVLARSHLIKSNTDVIVEGGVELVPVSGNGATAYNLFLNNNWNSAPQTLTSIVVSNVSSQPEGYEMSAVLSFQNNITGIAPGSYILIKNDPLDKFNGIFEVSSVNLAAKTVTLFLAEGNETGLPITITPGSIPMTVTVADSKILLLIKGKINGLSVSGNVAANNDYRDHLILFNNVINCSVEASIKNAVEYCICVANAQNFKFKSLDFNSPKDGLHVYGPVYGQLEIDGVSGETGDDTVVLQTIDGASFTSFMPPHSGGSFYGGATLKNVRPNWARNTGCVAIYPSSGASQGSNNFAMYGTYELDNVAHECLSQADGSTGSSYTVRIGGGYVPTGNDSTLDTLVLKRISGDIQIDNPSGSIITIDDVVVDEYTNIVQGTPENRSITFGANVVINNVTASHNKVKAPATVLANDGNILYCPYQVISGAIVNNFSQDTCSYSANANVALAMVMVTGATLNNVSIRKPNLANANNNVFVFNYANLTWANTLSISVENSDFSQLSSVPLIFGSTNGNVDITVNNVKVGPNGLFNFFGVGSTETITISGNAVKPNAVGQSLFVNHTSPNISIGSFNALSKQSLNKASGSTVTLNVGSINDVTIINPNGGAIAALTIAFPSSANSVDGERRDVRITGSVTTLSSTGSVIGLPASVTGSFSKTFIYDATNASWV